MTSNTETGPRSPRTDGGTDYENISEGDVIHVEYTSPRTKDGQTLEREGKVSDVIMWEMEDGGIDTVEFITPEKQCQILFANNQPKILKQKANRWTKLGEVESLTVKKTLTDGGHQDIRIIGQRPYGHVRVRYHPEDADTAERLFTYPGAARGCFEEALDNRKVRDGMELGFIRVDPENGNATEVHVRADILRDHTSINYASEVLEMANGEQPYVTFGDEKDPWSWEDPEFHTITPDTPTEPEPDSTRADGGEVVTDGGRVDPEDSIASLWAVRGATEDTLFVTAVGADIPTTVTDRAHARLQRKPVHDRLLASLARGEYHRIGYVTRDPDSPDDYGTWLYQDILPYTVPDLTTEDTATDGGRLMTDGGQDTVESPAGYLYGPNSAKNALSNAHACVHSGDQDGAKRWISVAEDRIQNAIDAIKEPSGGE